MKLFHHDPLSSLTYDQRGRKLKKEGKYQEAVRAFDTAISRQEDLYSSLFGKGECLNELGMYEKARETFQEAINLDSSNALAYKGLGITYYSQHHYEIAKEFFKKSLRRNKQSVTAWIGLGKVLNQQHQYDEAANAFRKALYYATKYRHDLLVEIEQQLTGLVEYKDSLEKEIERLQQENAELKAQLGLEKTVIVHGDYVQGTNIKDDAVVNRSHLGE